MISSVGGGGLTPGPTLGQPGPRPAPPTAPQHTCALHLLCQRLLGAVELKEERGRHAAVQLAMPVAGIHHDVIQELWDQGEAT